MVISVMVRPYRLLFTAHAHNARLEEMLADALIGYAEQHIFRGMPRIRLSNDDQVSSLCKFSSYDVEDYYAAARRWLSLVYV